jgi:hypothetical protein
MYLPLAFSFLTEQGKNDPQGWAGLSHSKKLSEKKEERGATRSHKERKAEVSW